MDRYPRTCRHIGIRYFAVFLVALHILAGGHVICAPCLSSPVVHHTEHDCGHPHHQASEILTSACCSDDHGGKPPCNGNDLPAIVVPSSADELAKLLEIAVADGVSVVHAACRQVVFRDTETYYSSVRLHMLYAVLVI